MGTKQSGGTSKPNTPSASPGLHYPAAVPDSTHGPRPSPASPVGPYTNNPAKGPGPTPENSER